MNDINKTSTMRPDNPIFFVMMGMFFFFFAIAPAYWAFYNFGEYRIIADLISQIEEKFKESPTPEAGQEYSERTTFLTSRAERYKLEMFLSGGGAIFLFGASALFFVKALNSRGNKILFEAIDLQTIPLPKAKIEVKDTYVQTVLFVIVITFFSLMSIFIFYQTLTSPFSTSREIIIKGSFSVFLFAIVLFFGFLQIRAVRNSLKIIDSSGVTRGDGKHFSWTQFHGVVTQTALNRFMKRYIWREELAFSDGETVWIIPQRIKNYNEVSNFISQLPKAVLKNST